MGRRIQTSVNKNRIHWFLLITFMVCSGADCPGGPGVARVGYVAPSRLHNATRAKNNTENLADLAQSTCTGARTAQGAETANNARTAATNLQIAMDMFDETPQGYARVEDAIKAAAEASRMAYYMVMSCGGIPPEVPRIPLYYETFWDIASP